MEVGGGGMTESWLMPPRRREPALEPLNRFETYFINRGAQALALREGSRSGMRCVPGCIPPQYRRGGLAPGNPVDKGPARRLPCRREQPDAPGHGRLGLEESRSHPEGGRIRRRDDDGVRGSDRPHPRQPLPECHRAEPPGHLSPEQLKFIQEHGSSDAESEEFYDWMVIKASEHVLPLIQD